MHAKTNTHRSRRRLRRTALGVVVAIACSACGPGTSNGAARSSATPLPKSSTSADAQEVSDLNGDGHRDVAFSSTAGTSDDGENYLAVVYGSKNGPNPKDRALFSAKKLGLTAQSLYQPYVSQPATGDLDGDGHPDVVAGSTAAVVWGGEKGPRPDSPTGKIQLPGKSKEYTQQPLAGDFDGDGHTDLATYRDIPKDGDTKAQLVVLHGPFTRDGKPTRTTYRSNPVGNDKINEIGWLTTGNADGGRATDLVVHRLDEEDTTSVLLAGGAKTDTGLSDKARHLPEGNQVVFGDFDGDGRQDTAVGNSGIPNDEDPDPKRNKGWVKVYYGKDPKTAHRITGGKVNQGFGVRLAPGDVDGDGKDDLAVQLSDSTGSHAKIQVLHGSADGLGSKPWRSTSRAAKGDPFTGEVLEAHDYTGDRKDEIAVVDSLYQDPKSHWWFTRGTDSDKAAFTTRGFTP